MNSSAQAVEQIEAAMTVKRVYGDPVESNGVTVLPVARVAAGAGGGGANGKSHGWGGGFGVVAQPLGVYVIDASGVRWMPMAGTNLLLSAIRQQVQLARRFLSGMPGSRGPRDRTRRPARRHAR